MTFATYNLGIPNGPNNPSADQPLMQTNTNSISSLIAIDHYGFNNPSGGWHKQVTLPVETLPATVAGQGALYTKTVSATSQLFYTPDGTTNEYQLTRTISASFAQFSTNNAYGTPPAGFTQKGGWTFLPGGMLLQYGFYGKTGATGSSGNIQFPVTWTTGAFSIQLSLYRTSGNQSLTLDSVNPSSTTKFSFLTSSSGSDGIFWTAIGI